MILKLLYSVPSKRFDPHQSMCVDGRGGWVFSQVNVDRVVSSLEDFDLIYGLGVLIEDAIDDDFVRGTRLTARMDGEIIGTNELEWKVPNPMWHKFEKNSIVEWAQSLNMNLSGEGLVEITLELRFDSYDKWLPVEGHAYCRVTLAIPEEIPELDRRFAGRLSFWWRSLFQKPFWPAGRSI